MSEHDQLIRQYQKQIATLQMLIAQASLGGEAAISKYNTRSNIEVAKLQTFNREVSKVSDFLTACKLFIILMMRDVAVEEQI